MKKNGFTLVELIVVMGIIGVLIAIATLQFNRTTTKTAIESELRTLSGDLAGARSQALFEKKGVAVSLTATTFAVYSSAVITPAPVLSKNLRYPVALDAVPNPLVFTSRGIIDGIDAASICIEPNDNDGAVDSIILTTTRIYTGKRNAGTACTKDNIVIK